MKKFCKFFAFAVVAVLASCSSDELEPSGQGTFMEGETAYLNVTLRDANELVPTAYLAPRTRAGENGEKDDSDTPVEGEFDYGTDNEAKVNKARFFFFDENGIYAGQANIWNGGTPSTDTPDENIEFKSTSLVVLDNLKSNTYPKYMVTILNGGDEYTNEKLTGVSLEEFSKQITSWGENKENGFLMASTSFFTTADTKNHTNNYYYATVLDQSNFARTAAAAKGTPAVNVFVERLAARVHLTSKEYFDVQTTVFGADGDNPDAGENEAATKLKVRIDGWFVNGTQSDSYLLKQLAGWGPTSNIPSTNSGNWAWNMPDFSRSYWGKSVNYGQIAGLNFFSYSATTNRRGQYVYCNENTSTVADLSANNNGAPNQQKLTSVVVKATVGTMDKDGKFVEGIYLIEHNGVYFTKDRFTAYVLDAAQAAIPYTRTWEGTGEGTDQANGKYVYTQLPASDFEIQGTNDRVYLAPTDAVLKADLETLYHKNGSQFTAEDMKNLETKLQDVTKNVRTRAFKDGMMYYNIPIAHLNTPKYDKETGDLITWQEGSFGVVRNHSYEVNINSVKRLGQGVFNPDDNEDPIKPDPDPKDPNWYLGATINILSWRIVPNDVNL